MRREQGQIARISVALTACGLVYAAYRAYYGFGGTIGMIGTPSSESRWKAINLGAAVVLLAIALLPLAALQLWRRPYWRRALLAVAWLLAVGGVMHALIMDTQRVLSLARLHEIGHPTSQWLTYDERRADLQDLLFNETWFLVEGVLWAVLASTVLRSSRSSARWTVSALGGVAIATCVGLLSAFGVAGRWVVG